MSSFNDICDANKTSSALTIHVVLSKFALFVHPDSLTNDISAFYRSDEITMSLEVFSVRDIKAGEEITISCKFICCMYLPLNLLPSYLQDVSDTDPELPSQIRMWVLKSRWNFDCNCHVCAGAGDKKQRSDEHLVQIEALKKKLQEEEEAGSGSPQSTLDHATNLLRLYDQEGLFVQKAEYHEMAAYAASNLGDLDAAVSHAKDATFHWKTIMGEGTIQLARLAEFLDNPTKHPTWKSWNT